MNSRWTAGVMDGELDFDGAPFISLSLARVIFWELRERLSGPAPLRFLFVLSPCPAAFPAVQVGSATSPFGVAAFHAGASRPPFAEPWRHGVARNSARHFCNPLPLR